MFVFGILNKVNDNRQQENVALNNLFFFLNKSKEILQSNINFYMGQ